MSYSDKEENKAKISLDRIGELLNEEEGTYQDYFMDEEGNPVYPVPPWLWVIVDEIKKLKVKIK